MVSRFIASIMLREIASLRAEIRAYDDETDLWAVPEGIANSAGTLALHLCGNVQHYVGAHLGGSSYVRDRPAEFARRNVPRTEIEAEIEAATAAVRRTFESFDENRLAETFPEAIMGRTVETGEFLVHLVSHLGYHLGQIDYHRRLTSRSSATVANLSIDGLVSARK